MRKQYEVLSAQISIFILAVSWFFWSFTQTDPNLYYSSNATWVNFQNMMWQIPRTTVVPWYVLMVVVSFCLYFFAISKREVIGNMGILVLLTTCFLLLLSNNALSHDLYNYMFNARAVAMYHQDPHVLSALEIAPQDEWVRFMHNVQTTAPYGHFWTYFSLIPYFAGLGKFITTFLSFKVFMAIGFMLLVWIQKKLGASNLLLFLANPLVLIETLMSGHNDIWMMVLALSSFHLLFRVKKVLSWQTITSLLLLALSTQIKFSTVLLLPVWVGCFLSQIRANIRSSGLVQKAIRHMRTFWAEHSAILLFIPLFTDRSQQFNPWYLIWPLAFLPFIKVKFIRILLILFSLTSMLRYIPFLIVAGYSDTVQLQMREITWSAIPIAVVVWLLVRKKRTNAQQNF